MTRAPIFCVAAVVLVGCFDIEPRDAPPQSEVSKLHGRCLVLRRPVLLVRTQDDGVVDAYLAEPENRGDTRLAAGDEIVVDRVVLTRAFEGRYATVVGRCKTKYRDRKISLFMLFDPTWLKEAGDAAFDDRRVDARLRGSALNTQWARWCE